MNVKQQNDDKMVFQVVKVYLENQADFDVIPAITEVMQRLMAIRKEIADNVAKQISDTTGTTKSKADKKDEVINLTFTMAGNIYSWAKKNNNAVVMGQSNIKIGQLTKLNDQLMAPTCRNIVDLAVANQEALVKYGVTADSIQQLSQLIDAFVTLSGQPTTNLKDRSGYTQKIKDLFKEANGLFIDSLDKLVMNIKTTKPDTFKSYQAARVTPSAGGGHNDAPPPTPPAV